MATLEALAIGGKSVDAEASTAESPDAAAQLEGASQGDKSKVAGDDASVVS